MERKSQQESLKPILRNILKSSMSLAKELIKPSSSLRQGITSSVKLAWSYHEPPWILTKKIIAEGHIRDFIHKSMKEHRALLREAYLQSRDKPHRDLIVPHKRDRRFIQKAWKTNPIFNLLKQSYLFHVTELLRIANTIEFEDEITKKQAIFLLKNILEAVSPSNFLLTNPELINLTYSTRGVNLLKGLNNFLMDLHQWHAHLNITRTLMTKFVVGEDIAFTPGYVVYENEVCQLIQYSPSTKEVFEIPLLITTSWINKYYVFDLRENNSLIRWLVSQGFTVFCISWINPGSEDRAYGFSDYAMKGPLACLKEIQKITGAKKINLAGYCLGGTLTAAVSAYLSKKNTSVVNSITCLCSLIDFKDHGDLSTVIGQKQVKFYKDAMRKYGYMEGRKTLSIFNSVKMNDYIWPYFINNYLRGSQPQTHDIFFWGQDVTNVPEALFSFYLIELFTENRLSQEYKVIINHESIAIKDVTVPTYFLGALDDTLAPWKTCYKSACLPQGSVRFVLTAANHVSGVLNTPMRKKYGYFAKDITSVDPDNWMKEAIHEKGSWWNDWSHWLTQHSGKQISAKPLNEKIVIEPAPGRYAKQGATDS